MALCFADSFDSFAATGDLLKKYSTAMTPWTWNSTGGPDGGGCVVAASTGNSTLITPLNIFPTSPTRVCIAFYLKISTPYQYYPYIRLYTNTGVHSARLQVSPNGAWSLTRGDGAIGLNVLNRNICDNRWHWIEVDISTVNAATTNKVWIDGAKEFEGAWTGDMTSTNINYFSMSSIDSATVSFCNIIAWDDTGSGLNFADFPIGPRSIDAIRPNGDNSVAFTRSTGSTSYTLVDEVNGDITDYVESNVSGTQDLYDYAALGFTPATINGVMLNTLVHTPMPGVINAQGVCKSSSTTSVGSSKLVTVNPQIIQQAYDLDPNGSIAWTQANLDAAQFGIKVA